MKAHFYSISNDDTIKFISDLKKDNNTYMFLDKSLENTHILLSINNKDSLLLKRIGDTTMNMDFQLGKKTKGNYKNNMGLEFDFLIFTKKIFISEEKINIEYDFIFDGVINNSYKIYVLIK